MRIKTVSAVVALALAAWMPSAFAEPGALNLDAVRSQQAEIRVGVESRTGIYKQLSESNREVLLRKQAQLLRIIGDKQAADDLDAGQRTEVFNALEQIEALINKSEDERMVCAYRATIGSNRKTRVCRTTAELRQEREAVRNQVDGRGVDSFIQRN